MAVKIFFCYAHEDKKMLDELRKHFIGLVNSRDIVVVTKEDLPNIGSILKREMVTPTYPKL